MIRFLTRILLISTFFIGLGAIADGVLKVLKPVNNQFVFEPQSEYHKVKIVKLERQSSEQYQFRMLLPNIDEFPITEMTIDAPLAKKKVVIFRQHGSFE